MHSSSTDGDMHAYPLEGHMGMEPITVDIG